MKRDRREKLIPVLMLLAVLAALGLGLTALALSRHEEEFRRQELRGLLRDESRLFAERCRRGLRELQSRLAERAAAAETTPAALRELVRSEPLAVAAFAAERSGRLLQPAAADAWRRRYDELFNGLIHTGADTEYSNVVMPQRQAAAYAAQGPDYPKKALLDTSSRLKEEEALPMMTAPEAAEPAAAAAPRLVSRFAALTRNRRSGLIPWFADNRFSPLLWAERAAEAGVIVGLELDEVALFSRLVPLFPAELPPYFRIELTDAVDRTVYAVGGGAAGPGGEPVFVMPVSELLPNLQVRAYLIPGALPTWPYRAGIVFGVASLILLLLTAGGVAVSLTRRELRLAGRKSSFVAQVSHELRTPLTSIRMYSELLRDHLPALPEEKRRRYLQVILDESERLTRLVGNVLDFSRLDGDRKTYHPSEVDLKELLASTADLWRELTAADGFTVTLRLPAELATVRIDRDSLLQILYNLFSNVVKYAAAGKRIDLALAAEGEYWVIALRDYGPGIPAAAREKVFQRFYRLDNALTAEHSGFGLGLAIARRLIRDQGGELACRDAAPGTTFTIKIKK